MRSLKFVFSWVILLSHLVANGQKLKTSDEIELPNRADMYAILGKLSDRQVLAYGERGEVTVFFFDDNLKKTGEKVVELERKSEAKVIDIFPILNQFYVIYSTKRKGRDIIKLHRYDARAKLVDSATVFEWAKNDDVRAFKPQLSENKKYLLLHPNLSSYDKDFQLVVVEMDSLKQVWQRKLRMDDRQDSDLQPESDPLQVVLANDGTLHLIRQFDNRKNAMEKHRITDFEIYGDNMTEKTIEIPNFLCLQTRFAYDNRNRQLVGVGLVGKDLARAQGYVLLNMSQKQTAIHQFDDDFVSIVEKKKITNNKGLENFELRDLILRQDGGVVAVAERIVERRHQSTMPQTSPFGFGGGGRGGFGRGAVSTDFYHDEIIAISIHPDGKSHWKSSCYKRQFSQNDGGIYGSYFISKTSQFLRLLYNDEIERSTTLSEYVLDGDGVNERRTFFNTEGLDLSIRFRDAVQISHNEIIAPSETRSLVRLVKITF